MASRPLRSSARSKPPSQTNQPPPARSASRTAFGRTTTPTPVPISTVKPPSKASAPAPRRPLVNRDNTTEFAAEAAKFFQAPVQAKPKAGSSKASPSSVADEREPIKAFLRLRPHLGEDEPPDEPNLESLSDTTVRMTDPGTGDAARARLRKSLAATSADYQFTRIFPAQTEQAEFFTNTTLPLVRDLLVEGRNGLLFAYGVTNSGKTYTMQGGSMEGSAGILPRTLDVIFNSIEGKQSEGKFRPIRLHGIEPNDMSSEADVTLAQMRAEPALATVLDELSADGISMASSGDVDPTTFTLDKNYEYSLWLSYAEVYNEKAYDLLAPSSSGAGLNDSTSRIPRSTGSSAALTLSRRALAVKPSPPSDGADSDLPAGKYVAGLRHVRVRSAAEAKALVRLGQLHRQVFGTLANSQSSRSHGLVTLKLLRSHRGEADDMQAVQSARLTLVDLAGSERTKHTHTSGDRLKEAGSINKSLMVLGQCLETLRANQRRIAQSLGQSGRQDTRDAKRAQQVVPFRHSKLTEVLMDYFVGDGRVVMLVNVNPYDTGFEENSHVMRFSAIARDVSTVALAPKPTTQPPKSQAAKPRSVLGNGIPPAAQRRSVTLSIGGGSRVASQTQLEVLEEDEEVEEATEDADEEPVDGLIQELFEEIEDLRIQLFESEMRCALVEAEVREEVMHEMEERMQRMETMFQARLANEFEQNDRKTNAKIELLHRSGMLGNPPAHHSDVEMDDEEYEEELDVEASLRQDDYLDGIVEEEEEEVEGSRTPSPLAGKEKNKPILPTSLELDPMDLPPIIQDVPMLDLGNDETDPTGVEPIEISEDEPAADDSEDEYVPPPSTKSRASKAAPPRRKPSSVSRQPEVIAIDDSDDNAQPEDGDDSVLVIPNKQARAAAIAGLGPSAEYVPRPGEVDTVKKKKRQLGKKAVVTGDQINRLVEQQAADGKHVRRMTRRAP